MSNKNTKLSVKNQTCFKKSSKKTMNLGMREKTLLNKAYELSTLCEIDICLLHYDLDGELIKTWPEDQSKVRNMAERFNKLSDHEKLKKNTNLSQCLRKKMMEDMKHNENKFTQKVLDIETSLENHLRILQDRFQFLRFESETEKKTETDEGRGLSSSLIMEDQSGGFFTSNNTLPSSSLFAEDPHQPWTSDQIYSNSFTSSGLSSTPWLNHHLIENQNKYSILLFNHQNNSLCQLPHYVPSFSQDNNLSQQGFGNFISGCNNDIHLSTMFPPQMQPSNVLF